MPIYTYKARDEAGKLVTGSMEAANKDVLAVKLQKLKLTVISLKEKSEGFSLDSIDKFLSGFTRVKIDDLVMFDVQLSNMISAGISLPTSLMTLTEQIDNVRLRNAIAEVYEDIKGGATFSDSLKKHPDIFSNLFTNMIHAGEVAGNLDEILSRLASFAEHDAELKQRITTAMFYPMILAVAGSLVIILIIVTILPSFAKIFIDANVPLPLPTLILYNANLFIRAFWKYVIAAIVGLYLLLRWYKGTPNGKYTVDKALLNIPVWGKLIRHSTIARLSRTLASLISSGVPMLQALDVAEKTLDNAIISNVLKNVYSSVSKGETISKPLADSGEFPAMPVHMIAVGEETGALDTMLNKVADYYDMATDYSIKRITALLEPMFLVVIGGAVGFIFASILLPIFQMVKTLKH
jgi:type IV pilus assembly protein PilC